MSQPRYLSLLEAVTSTVIGFWVAVGTQVLVFPLFDLQVTIVDNLGIAAIFTGVSIVRGYLVRRWFNKVS